MKKLFFTIALLASTMIASAQVYEEPVAYRYQVPMVSYRDAYKNVADFEKFAADVVHPNIIGHTYLALNLVYYILFFKFIQIILKIIIIHFYILS